MWGVSRFLLMLGTACRTPALAMLPDPVKQRPLETDIVTEPLGFEPFVTENLLTFRQEFLIKIRLFHEVS